MNAFELLKEDHKKVKALLEELEGSTERAVKKRTTLLAQIDISYHRRKFIGSARLYLDET